MPEIKKIHFYTLGLILLVALGLRLPLINNNLPFFYDEDEAHHFNRQVNMLKTGELNPKYFLKPTLNFYMRLPSIAAGFLWSVKNGQARSIQDIQTKDPYGLAGYAFTVSHPAVLKANRLYSIAIALLIIAGAYFLTLVFTQSNYLSMVAGIVSTLSPLAYQHSISVGVNMPAAMFCLYSVIFASLYIKKRNVWLIFISAFLAGFAVSTKYNALPIMLVPFVIVFFHKPFNIWHFIIGAKVPWFAFLLASPFILAEIPLFLDHIAYEIWHYGVAGHVGHEGVPGLEQLSHYMTSLGYFDFGWGFLVLGLIGLWKTVRLKKLEAWPLALFVLAFIVLMSLQKANFNRNMLLILPLLAPLAGIGWMYIDKFIGSKIVAMGVFFIFCFQPLLFNLEHLFSNVLKPEDSRMKAFKFLHTPENANSNLAIDGRLQLPRFIRYENGRPTLSRPGTTRVNFNQKNLSELYLDGYEEILTFTDAKLLRDKQRFFRLRSDFYGNSGDQRIINSPGIFLLQFNQGEPWVKTEILDTIEKESLKTFNVCKKHETEDELWIKQKITILDTSDCPRNQKTNLKFISPWNEQDVVLFQGNKTVSSHDNLQPGAYELSVTNPNPKETLYLWLEYVKSPQAEGISKDSRRLGIRISQAP